MIKSSKQPEKKDTCTKESVKNDGRFPPRDSNEKTVQQHVETTERKKTVHPETHTHEKTFQNKGEK